MTEVFIFARFRALSGQEAVVAAAIRAVTRQTAAEAQCLSIAAFNGLQDPRLFWIHSRWRDEAAFEAHAKLPHTVAFLAAVEPLIDHPLDVCRTVPLSVREDHPIN